jgi:type IV pilus assembly protein PilC
MDFGFKKKPKEEAAPAEAPVTELKGQNEQQAKRKSTFNLKSMFLHVPLQEKVLFARHIAVAIKSGMTLNEGLKLVLSQTKSKSFKQILTTVVNDTNNGMFLSASMSKYQDVFGELFVNIVRVGEQSGTLVENLNYLAVELKKKKELHSKVRGAMIYPMVILCATLGIVATLMIGVFPKILPVFQSMNIKLPLTTKILIATSTFMSTYTLYIIGGFALFVFALWYISHFDFFKHAWHHTILRLPVIGKIAIKVNSATLTRTLGLLLNSGVQIIEAVNITASTLDNYVYRHELSKAGETLRRGDMLTSYLKKNTKLFPPIMTNMIEVGENTGNLVENLNYLSEFYGSDVDEVLKNLSSIIEPILLLFMGLMVGFMALSVVTPIYQISQSLTL